MSKNINDFLIENILKNLVILFCLFFLYFPLKDYLLSVPIAAYDSILFVSTLLIMAFLFADYAFTFASHNLNKLHLRLLGQIITALIIFGTGALLEITNMTLNLKIGKPFPVFEML